MTVAAEAPRWTTPAGESRKRLSPCTPKKESAPRRTPISRGAPMSRSRRSTTTSPNGPISSRLAGLTWPRAFLTPGRRSSRVAAEPPRGSRGWSVRSLPSTRRGAPGCAGSSASPRLSRRWRILSSGGRPRCASSYARPSRPRSAVRRPKVSSHRPSRYSITPHGPRWRKGRSCLPGAPSRSSGTPSRPWFAITVQGHRLPALEGNHDHKHRIGNEHRRNRRGHLPYQHAPGRGPRRFFLQPVPHRGRATAALPHGVAPDLPVGARLHREDPADPTAAVRGVLPFRVRRVRIVERSPRRGPPRRARLRPSGGARFGRGLRQPRPDGAIRRRNAGARAAHGALVRRSARPSRLGVRLSDGGDDSDPAVRRSLHAGRIEDPGADRVRRPRAERGVPKSH